jgi:hypothetical protein
MTARSTADGGLVREFDSRGEGSDIGGVDVRSNVGRWFDGVIASDVDRTDEGVEVASGYVVGVVPIDHTPGPIDGTLGSSWDASGPNTSVK